MGTMATSHALLRSPCCPCLPSGAAIRTYLLERSRVVSLNDPERNYHVFYQVKGRRRSVGADGQLSGCGPGG
jgi:hypothetical protein